MSDRRDIPSTTVMVTRLRVRAPWQLPAFLGASFRIAAQASGSDGFVGGRLAFEPPLAFWTVTVWEDPAAMRAFGGSGPHRPAMPRTDEWARAASNVRWEQAGRTVPSWRECRRRMAAEGRPFGSRGAPVGIPSRAPLPALPIPVRTPAPAGGQVRSSAA